MSLLRSQLTTGKLAEKPRLRFEYGSLLMQPTTGKLVGKPRL
jgi:hypothetical protein